MLLNLQEEVLVMLLSVCIAVEPRLPGQGSTFLSAACTLSHSEILNFVYMLSSSHNSI